MERLPIRGGSWNNGADAGVAALNLNNRRVNVNSNIGFRPALLQGQKPLLYGGTDRAMEKRSLIPSPIGENINSRARPNLTDWPSRGAFSMSCRSNIWDKVIDFENLYAAYKAATKGKRYRRASLEFASNLEENLITIQNELIWGTWQPLPLREFWINEPERRLISAPSFRDRVVHHAIVQVVEPLFDRRFIHDSHACRIHHGTILAVHRVQQFARQAKRRWGSYYVYKGDIKSYFPSVRHDILKAIVRKTIKDLRVLDLLDRIIDSNRNSPGCGIPIGSLTSQLLANAYLDILDHYAKDRLGIKYYVRYMDDFVVIAHDKKEIRALSSELERFIKSNLSLTVNPKSGYFHGRNGIAFCGFRIWATHILLRKRILRCSMRRLRKLVASMAPQEKIRESIMSFTAHAKHASSRRSVESILGKIIIRGGSQ